MCLSCSFPETARPVASRASAWCGSAPSVARTTSRTSWPLPGPPRRRDLTLLTGAGRWRVAVACCQGAGAQPKQVRSQRRWPAVAITSEQSSCRALPSLTPALAAPRGAGRPRAGGRLGRSAVAEQRLHRRDGVPQPAAAADCPPRAARCCGAADASGLAARRAARALPPALPFVTIAADGETDIHGVIQRCVRSRWLPMLLKEADESEVWGPQAGVRPNTLLSDRRHLLYARMAIHTDSNRLALIARLLLRTDPGLGRAGYSHVHGSVLHKPSGWRQALAESASSCVEPPHSGRALSWFDNVHPYLCCPDAAGQVAVGF